MPDPKSCPNDVRLISSGMRKLTQRTLEKSGVLNIKYWKDKSSFDVS